MPIVNKQVKFLTTQYIDTFTCAGVCPKLSTNYNKDMARNVYGDGYQYYHGKCCVFISHQQKDKAAAKLIANYLLSCGIDVYFLVVLMFTLMNMIKTSIVVIHKVLLMQLKLDCKRVHI